MSGFVREQRRNAQGVWSFVLSGHLFRTCQRVRPRDHRHGAFYTRFLKIIRKNAGSFVACRPILGEGKGWSPTKKSKTVSQHITFRAVSYNAKIIQSQRPQVNFIRGHFDLRLFMKRVYFKSFNCSLVSDF